MYEDMKILVGKSAMVGHSCCRDCAILIIIIIIIIIPVIAIERVVVAD